MKKRHKFDNISLLITVGLFIILYSFGGINYASRNFLTWQSFINLFKDNAFLLIATVGTTFVLIVGGIDISIASNIALTGMLTASWLSKGMSIWLVLPLTLLVGTFAGFVMGYMIQVYKVQPFIATLAGQFFMRGMCSLISIESIVVNDPTFTKISMWKLVLFQEVNAKGKTVNVSINAAVIISFAVVLIAMYVLRYTRYGRTIYAIGGNEQSAMLMGLPVTRTKISVYTLNGFLAALSGIVFTMYTLSGYSLQNIGVELDAISSAVIGGTLLTGGVGSVVGSLLGVMIQGTIKTIVTYANLNTWWTKVTMAGLLCIFVLIQRLLALRSEKRQSQS
ncbi:MAG: ABC transporter permease subunit [Christensenellales bacterium]|jgi:ribose/xylose/arabinose/galactoside ABC-type transport system permease subunit